MTLTKALVLILLFTSCHTGNERKESDSFNRNCLYHSELCFGCSWNHVRMKHHLVDLDLNAEYDYLISEQEWRRVTFKNEKYLSISRLTFLKFNEEKRLEKVKINYACLSTPRFDVPVAWEGYKVAVQEDRFKYYTGDSLPEVYDNGAVSNFSNKNFEGTYRMLGGAFSGISIEIISKHSTESQDSIWNAYYDEDYRTLYYIK